MIRILKFALQDLLKSRFITGYTLILLAVSVSMFQMDSDAGKAMLSLINIVLIVVPLICLIFTIIYYYNAQEFTELLLVQPIPRRQIILGQGLAVALALSSAFLIGCGVPIALYAPTAVGFTLLASGWLLTLVFVALAFAISVTQRDKARGIGLGLLIWFYFALLYDGLLLLLLFMFNDYPIEKWVLPLASLNPVDMARILVLLHLDLAALMGYSGAVYKQFLGSIQGIIYTLLLLSAWITGPAWFAVRRFQKKDF